MINDTSQGCNKPKGQMRFAFTFYNFPNLAAIVIQCGIHREEMRVIPKHFISSNNGRTAFYFFCSNLHLAAVIFPVELNVKTFMRHAQKLNGLANNVTRVRFLSVIFDNFSFL